MQSPYKTILLSLSLSMAVALAACGGGDDSGSPTAATSGTTTPTLACDVALFSITATVPTSAQLTAYAKTYAGSVGTLVFKADGSATYKGVALDLKSVCYIDDSRSKSIVLHWGTRGTAGAAAFYDNHVDLFADGTASGSIGTDIFKSP